MKLLDMTNVKKTCLKLNYKDMHNFDQWYFVNEYEEKFYSVGIADGDTLVTRDILRRNSYNYLHLGYDDLDIINNAFNENISNNKNISEGKYPITTIMPDKKEYSLIINIIVINDNHFHFVVELN